MASARAAPRASSRSRHNFPVAECATPRNAGGVSIGNADAGSVMMLSRGKQEARRFNDSRAAATVYTVILRCEPLYEPRRMTARGPSFEARNGAHLQRSLQ